MQLRALWRKTSEAADEVGNFAMHLLIALTAYFMEHVVRVERHIFVFTMWNGFDHLHQVVSLRNAFTERTAQLAPL